MNRPAQPRHTQHTLLYVHVRRDLVEAGASLEEILADVNEKVRRHKAIVLANGQFLCRPIELDWSIEPYFSDETTIPFEHPSRQWGTAQRDYFEKLWGVTEPYQYAVEVKSYDRYCVAALDPTPYLGGDERVLALVEAERDGLYLDCPCHNTEVVYTSRQRLVCMGCGHLHCVLAEKLAHHFEEGLSNVQWDSAFDEDGELVDDTLSIPVIDYREIEPLAKLWIADAWREATWLIDFYATATPEEIADYERGLPSAKDFIEAGFHQVATPPSAAAQLDEHGYGFDIAQNAAAALGGAAVAYSRSKTDPKSLRKAVLQVFHATELVLKIRLEQVTPGALAKRPNNPSVMQQLQAIGIVIRPEELEIVEGLRALGESPAA